MVEEVFKWFVNVILPPSYCFGVSFSYLSFIVANFHYLATFHTLLHVFTYV